MKVINKDNIEKFKKRNKIKDWASYLMVNFIEGMGIILGILLSIALVFAPVILIIMFVMTKSAEIGLIAIVVYLFIVFYMWSSIDDKIREDKRKW